MNSLQESIVFKSCGIATYPPGAIFGPRRSTDWEFVWLIEGDALYRWNAASDEESRDNESCDNEGFRTLEVPENSLLLCRRGVTDFFRWDTQCRTRHGYFHFDFAAWPQSWPPIETWPLLRKIASDDIATALLRQILERRESPHDPLRKIAIAHLLLEFCSRSENTAKTPSAFTCDVVPLAVQSAHDFIFRRLSERPEARLSLSEIARAAHVSPEHLCRAMKAATGHSPQKTVRLARLDMAATLLVRSNYAVGEVATLCGFASAFHFSRRFKEAHGRSPRELRNAVKNGETPPASLLLHDAHW